MKHYLKILMLLLLPLLVKEQQDYSDSLGQALKIATTDSAKFSTLFNLGIYYDEDNSDSVLKYVNQARLIARKNDRKLNEASCLAVAGKPLAWLGKYVEYFESFQEASQIAEDPANENKAWKNDKFSFHQNRLDVLGWVHLLIGISRGFADSTDKQLSLPA